MRLFRLVRHKDVSGVSGVGTVAEGVEFRDGSCAMYWLTNISSIGIYKSIDDLIAIHGHDDNTIVKFQNTELIVKPNWNLGTQWCKHCDKGMEPTAYLDDGWYLHWSCDCGEMIEDAIEWPFVDDYAYAKDLERLGFIII